MRESSGFSEGEDAKTLGSPKVIAETPDLKRSCLPDQKDHELDLKVYQVQTKMEESEEDLEEEDVVNLDITTSHGKSKWDRVSDHPTRAILEDHEEEEMFKEPTQFPEESTQSQKKYSNPMKAECDKKPGEAPSPSPPRATGPLRMPITGDSPSLWTDIWDKSCERADIPQGEEIVESGADWQAPPGYGPPGQQKVLRAAGIGPLPALPDADIRECGRIVGETGPRRQLDAS
jgi:hypothetical protein